MFYGCNTQVSLGKSLHTKNEYNTNIDHTYLQHQSVQIHTYISTNKEKNNNAKLINNKTLY